MRPKLSTMVAGARRGRCWFLNMGDYLAMRPDRLFDPDVPRWLLPDLQLRGSSAGQVMGKYVKDLRPVGGADAYKHVIPQMKFHVPNTGNAGGFRPGACNTLLSSMPVEIAVHSTGHISDCAKSSAVWQYIDAKEAMCMPGAIAMAGWRPLPFGTLGRGPKAPTLKALEERGLQLEPFERMIDTLYRIDNTTPATLMRGGDMRPAVQAAFAAQIMYYSERMNAGEVRSLLIAMKHVYTKHALPQWTKDPQVTYLSLTLTILLETFMSLKMTSVSETIMSLTMT